MGSETERQWTAFGDLDWSTDEPIMQWVPFIKKLQKAGKGVMVDLKPKELVPFMNEVNPKGIFLCISANEDIQPDIIKKVEKWK